MSWLSMIKMLPVLLLLAGVGYAGHWYKTNQLETQLALAQSANSNLRTQNSALQASAQINSQTIKSLETQIQRQQQQIVDLQNNVNSITEQRDRYMDIFRRHDLRKLALAKPGLIENRINSGTSEILQQLEEESQP